MALGPQFFPKGENVYEGQAFRERRVSKDATLYHGTGGGIDGGVVRPNEGMYGKGAYATDDSRTAGFYAGNVAYQQGRLFGTVYEVTPMSDKTTHVDTSEAGAVLMDPEGLRADKAVSFPPAVTEMQYERAYRRADEIKKHGWSNIRLEWR